MLSTDPAPLEIFLLGLIEFEDVLRLQRRLIYDLGERGGGSLILCEHPPTLSVGRSGSRAHIRPDDEVLRSIGVRVHWVARGGGCLLHLPGQLCGYLSLSLEAMGVGRYVETLHQMLVDVLADFDLKGRTRPDAPGVFLDKSRVASVGVGVNRWIASHGFTLNVGPYLGPFEDLLEEPGPSGGLLHQTSMESRRQRPASMAKVRESLIRRLEERFGLERHHVYTEHPLIRRKVTPHVYAQSLG